MPKKRKYHRGAEDLTDEQPKSARHFRSMRSVVRHRFRGARAWLAMAERQEVVVDDTELAEAALEVKALERDARRLRS